MATEDYFSIEDILSSEPRVYTTLHVRGHNLAHLDLPGAAAHWATNDAPESPLPEAHPHTSDLPPGHRLALPFWLADALAQRGAVSLELPRCFGTAVRHALRADAREVSLYRKCPAYYSLGVRLAGLVRDPTLSGVLARAFAGRCWGVVDSAVFAGGRGIAALEGLEDRERALFFAAHGLDIALRRWKERRAERILPGVEGALGKRKRSEVGSPVTPRAPALR